MFMVLNQGIRVSQRSGLDKQGIKELLEGFLTLIGVDEPSIDRFSNRNHIRTPKKSVVI